jgi:hypothetical protein
MKTQLPAEGIAFGGQLIISGCSVSTSQWVPQTPYLRLGFPLLVSAYFFAAE